MQRGLKTLGSFAAGPGAVGAGGTFPTSKFSSTWVRLWDGFNFSYSNDNAPNYIYPLSDGNFLLCDPNGIAKVNAKTGDQIWYAGMSFSPNFVIEHPGTGKIVYSYYSGNINIYNPDGTLITLTGGGVSGIVGGVIGNFVILINGTTIYKVDMTTNTLVWSGTPTGYTNYPTNSILASDGSFMYNITYSSGPSFEYQKLDVLATTPTRVAVGNLANTGTAPTVSFVSKMYAPSRKFGNLYFAAVNMNPPVMYKFDLAALTSTSIFSTAISHPVLGVDPDDNIWHCINPGAGTFGGKIYKNGTKVLDLPDRLANIATKDGINFVAVYLAAYTNASSVLAQKPATMAIASKITV